MLSLTFLRRNLRWLAAGFLLSLSSSFGQTYFISLFAGEIRGTFDLSHGDFGGLYTLATLASAATLAWLGKLADSLTMTRISAVVLLGLALTTIGMSAVASPLMLVFVIYGLRFFGQGMLSHLCITAMSRWYAAQRGRAISLAALGFPVGEAAFPVAAVALMAVIGWRSTWIAAAGFLLLVSLPLVFSLLRREPALSDPDSEEARLAAGKTAARDWTRGEVLRDPLFYALLPGILAPPFVLTGVFFHQVHIVETKGWSLTWFAANFTTYAVATVATSLLAGWIIDRWSAAKLLPLYLLPMAAALVALAVLQTPWAVPAFMTLVGCTTGGATTLLGALWAELYGTRHIGAIRALAISGMVFATALAPGVLGWALDLGVTVPTLLVAMSLYSVLGASLFFALTRNGTRLAGETA